MKAHDMHDGELLKEYIEQDSQAAFATLAERYMNLVYSVCLREVRNTDLAHDVTQVVFLLLAKKAPSLRSEQTLAGWLYKTARFASKDALKQERRRQYREQKAGEEIMHLAQFEDRELTWAEIEPTLYTALDSLGQEDREAVLLRFFQKNSLKEVGANLGISEDAARMKVSRAVEKLRRHFKRHGFIISGATLGALLSANAVQAAPASCLAAAIGLGSYAAGGAALTTAGSGAALAGAHGVAAKGAVQTLFDGVARAMLISQVKVATVVVVGSAALGTGITKVVQRAQARTTPVTKPLAKAPRRVSVAVSAPRPVAKPLQNLRPVIEKPLFAPAKPEEAKSQVPQPEVVPPAVPAPQRAVAKVSTAIPPRITKPTVQLVSVPSKPAPPRLVESMVPKPETTFVSPIRVDLPLPAVAPDPALPKAETPVATVQTVTFDGKEVPIPQFPAPEVPKSEEPKEAVAPVKIAEAKPEEVRNPEQPKNDRRQTDRKNGTSIILGLLSKLSRAPIFTKPGTGFNQPNNRFPGFGAPPVRFGDPRPQYPQRGFGAPPPINGWNQDRDQGREWGRGR